MIITLNFVCFKYLLCIVVVLLKGYFYRYFLASFCQFKLILLKYFPINFGKAVLVWRYLVFGTRHGSFILAVLVLQYMFVICWQLNLSVSSFQLLWTGVCCNDKIVLTRRPLSTPAMFSYTFLIIDCVTSFRVNALPTGWLGGEDINILFFKKKTSIFRGI